MLGEAAKIEHNYLFHDPSDARLLCAFSTLASGNMSLNCGDRKDALRNRRKLLKGFGISHGDLVCAKQAHGSRVACVNDNDKGRGALSYDNALSDTDALITERSSVPLSVFTADCLSIFLYDHMTPAIGLVHAGWRGSRENIAAKTVEAMKDKFNSRAQDLCAAFGPAIRSCCYEVGGEFSGFFAPEYLTRTNGRYYLDLAAVNKGQLLGAGVKDKNIFDCGLCTCCRSSEFFSYRRQEAGSGRMMSVMMLR